MSVIQLLKSVYDVLLLKLKRLIQNILCACFDETVKQDNVTESGCSLMFKELAFRAARHFENKKAKTEQMWAAITRGTNAGRRTFYLSNLITSNKNISESDTNSTYCEILRFFSGQNYTKRHDRLITKPSNRLRAWKQYPLKTSLLTVSSRPPYFTIQYVLLVL